MSQPKSSFIRGVASRNGRMSRPPLVFGVMLAASLLFRCSDKSGGAVTGTCPGGPCGGAGGQSNLVSGGAPSIFTMTGGSAGAGLVPVLSCTGVVDCPLPPSVCANSASLAYFTDPICDHGTCRWATQMFLCSGYNCRNGACGPPGTIGTIFNTGGTGGGGTAGAGGVPNGQGGVFHLDAGAEPPTYLCSDAGAGSECPLPPSRCADASTLTAYGKPNCTYGSCSWTRYTIPCSGTCQSGHCMADRADENACMSRDASACALPPSECLDHENLLYFSNPRCVDSGSGLRCATEARVLDCGGRGCMDGGCAPRFTLPL